MSAATDTGPGPAQPAGAAAYPARRARRWCAAGALLLALAQGRAGAWAQPGSTAEDPATGAAAPASAAAPPIAVPTAAAPAVAMSDGPTLRAAALLPGERLRLDGTLAHPAWQRAPVHGRFVERAPRAGVEPSHATRVRVLYDAQALWVGIEALDPAPERLRAPLVRHDGVNRTQDFVAVYIDAIGSRQSAQFFRVNAAGSTADGMHTAADDSEDFAPDFDFDAATARHAQGWTAVLRIPFASLRFTDAAPADGPDGAPRPWRFMVVRRVPREQFHLYTSVAIPRDAPSFIAALQPLAGVQRPEDHAFLTLRPSLTLHHQHRRPVDGPAQARGTVDATLDAKWRPRPELVVDATLNPDFSQVAQDVPQLAGNTRFALLFAETRPFFFESSDLLRSPTDALYTRSFTAPRGGLRATWRGARLAGSAFAVDDRGGGAVLLPGPYGSALAAQPASRTWATRLRGDAGSLQWGALATERRYADGLGHNRVAGPDLGWQLDEAWRLRAQWLQSETTAQPRAGRLQAGPAERGRQAHARLWYQTAGREAELGWTDTGAGFRNDSGFLVQNGVQRLAGRVGEGWHPLGPFNDLWLNLEFEQVRDPARGQTVSREFSPGVWLTGAHNLEAWAYWHGGPGRSVLRTGPDQPLLPQRYWRAGLTLTPAPWAPLLSLEGRRGRLVDVGAGQVRPGGQLTVSLNARPLPPLELEPRLSWAWLDRDGRRSYEEAGHQLLARWHLGPRLSLRGIWTWHALERAAEPGAAAQRSADAAASLTLAWRPAAGHALYMGLSRQRDGGYAPAADAGFARGREAFIKLQVDAGELARRF